MHTSKSSLANEVECISGAFCKINSTKRLGLRLAWYLAALGMNADKLWTSLFDSRDENMEIAERITRTAVAIAAQRFHSVLQLKHCSGLMMGNGQIVARLHTSELRCPDTSRLEPIAGPLTPSCRSPVG